MRVGSVEDLIGRDGLVFSAVGLTSAAQVKAFEQKVGRLLPDNCEDIFDVQGPFLVGRHMVFLFRKDYDGAMIPALTLWRIKLEEQACVWVADYLAQDEGSWSPTEEL